MDPDLPVFGFISSSGSLSSDEEFLEEGSVDAKCYSWIDQGQQDDFHHFWVNVNENEETGNTNTEELQRLSVGFF